MTYLMFAVFIVSTGIHLYASAKKNQRLRNCTKPFILASLLGFYLSIAAVPGWFVIAALLFSWLGDMLLIPSGVKWFAMGGVSFMIAHGFFIAAYTQEIDFSRIQLWLILILAAIFIVLVCIAFKKLKPHLMKDLFYPMFFYLLVNGAMNCFAIFRIISNPCSATITTCIGAILFFISDTTLFFVRFKKDSKFKTHFWVMLTYSLGELLIVLGLR